MALFDFLKGLTASDRRELEAKYAQMVTVNELKEQVKALQKAIVAIKPADMSGYVKAKDIPKMPDVSGFVTKKDLPDMSKYALTKDIPSGIDLTGYALAKDIPKQQDLSKYVLKTELPKPQETAIYWKNQNTKHTVDKATLFIDTTAPTKAPDNQITLVTK